MFEKIITIVREAQPEEVKAVVLTGITILAGIVALIANDPKFPEELRH